MEIKRDYYLNQLIQKKENGLIKIITGIRRCGKSYLLNNIFRKHLLENGVLEENIIYIAVDSIENRELLDGIELNKYILSKITNENKYYILLDEIQMVSDFVSVLNSLMKNSNLDIFITGSNSKFLSSDIATEFRGRGDVVHIYPLSFSEFNSVYEGSVNEAWKEYYTYGGLPLVLLQKTDESKMKYLEDGVKNVYLNDVVERNGIQNEKTLETLVNIISSSIGCLTNPLKLANTFQSNKIKITDKTIYSYLKYLTDAYLIENAMRYDIKGKKYIETPQKYYFTDIGIRNSILSFRQQEETHILENIIYIELRKRGYKVDVGVVDIKENNVRKQLEIDFVANKGDDKIYIQSSLAMPTIQKENQEKKSLTEVNDFFKRIVLVKDDIKRYRDEQGIIIMSIFEFLLDENSLKY